MRNIADVIDRIIAEIPPPNGAEILRLTKIKLDSGYNPPECRRKDWIRLCEYLNERFPYPPETDWQRRILDITTDK